MTLAQILLELHTTLVEKWPNLCKSRAITLTLLNEYKSDTPGTKLHMVINITLPQTLMELCATQLLGGIDKGKIYVNL
jgi:hypothetical protein